MNLNVTLAEPSPRTSRILRLKQVINRSGLSKATLYRLGRLGHFPKPFKIGLAAVGWDELEIALWIEERKLLNTIH